MAAAIGSLDATTIGRETASVTVGVMTARGTTVTVITIVTVIVIVTLDVTVTVTVMQDVIATVTVTATVMQDATVTLAEIVIVLVVEAGGGSQTMVTGTATRSGR